MLILKRILYQKKQSNIIKTDHICYTENMIIILTAGELDVKVGVKADTKKLNKYEKNETFLKMKFHNQYIKLESEKSLYNKYKILKFSLSFILNNTIDFKLADNTNIKNNLEKHKNLFLAAERTPEKEVISLPKDKYFFGITNRKAIIFSFFMMLDIKPSFVFLVTMLSKVIFFESKFFFANNKLNHILFHMVLFSTILITYGISFKKIESSFFSTKEQAQFLSFTITLLKLLLIFNLMFLKFLLKKIDLLMFFEIINSKFLIGLCFCIASFTIKIFFSEKNRFGFSISVLHTQNVLNLK